MYPYRSPPMIEPLCIKESIFPLFFLVLSRKWWRSEREWPPFYGRRLVLLGNVCRNPSPMRPEPHPKGRLANEHGIWNVLYGTFYLEEGRRILRTGSRERQRRLLTSVSVRWQASFLHNTFIDVSEDVKEVFLFYPLLQCWDATGFLRL